MGDPCTSRKLSSPPVIQLVFFVPCLVLLSVIVTIILLCMVGYMDEIRVICQEMQGFFWSYSARFKTPLRMAIRVFSTMAPLGVGRDHNDMSKQDFSNYTVYDLSDLEFNDGDDPMAAVHLLKRCREKGALQNFELNTLCRSVLTKEMISTFHKDGVIAIRGLLSPELIRNLNRSSDEIVQRQLGKVGFRTSTGKQFFMNKMGPAFTNDDNDFDSHWLNKGNDLLAQDKEEENLPSSAFRDVALSSLIPQVAAELLGMDYNSNEEIHDTNSIDSKTVEKENLRMLRDVLLVKDADKFICGWHVDDSFFWPTTASSPGINAWVAIDDMASSTGGNFAVSVGTHNVPWKEYVYELTGATMTLPTEGYKDVYDFFENRKGFGTCNIKNVALELNELLEERKRVYDLKAGDILFMTRWIFHRTIPFDRNFVKMKKKQGLLHELLSRRYSIRYAPGASELLKGYGTELSILWNEENQGRTLDAVAQHDDAWYPKCWPHGTNGAEQSKIQQLIREKLPIAEKRRKERINEMKPFLQQIGQQQYSKQKKHAMHIMKEKGKEL